MWLKTFETRGCRHKICLGQALFVLALLRLLRFAGQRLCHVFHVAVSGNATALLYLDSTFLDLTTLT